MEVVINNHTYTDGQKIKWDEFGNIIYGTIHYGLFDLDGSGGEYSSRLVYGSEGHQQLRKQPQEPHHPRKARL